MVWPNSALDIEVSIALDATANDNPAFVAWTDITRYVRQEPGVTIDRGRGNWRSWSPPSTCTLVLDNRDGRFVPRNPLGPYYGRFGRGTPLRVTVDSGIGGGTRFIGFISEWPTSWDPSESDYFVRLRADGPLRRLNLSRDAPLSAGQRTVFAQTATPLHFWSMSGPQAITENTPTMLVSDITGSSSPDLSWITGKPTPAVMEAFSSAGRDIYVRPKTGLILTDEAVTVDSALSARPTANSSSFTLSHRIGDLFVNVICNWATGVPTMTLTTNTGTLDTADATVATSVWDETAHAYRVLLEQAGGVIDVTVYFDGVEVMTSSVASTALTGAVRSGFLPGLISANRPEVVWGNITVWGDGPTVPASLADIAEAMRGWPGEIATDRFDRLCVENSLVRLISASSSQTMGPQTPMGLVDLFRECEAAAQGVLLDTIDGVLSLQSLEDRERQPVRLTVDYASQQVAPPLEPADDDQHDANDVTVTRTNGSSARVVQTGGPLGTDSVGVFAASATINMESDEAAVHYAGWGVALGTVDAYWFPSINVNLRRSPSLVTEWLALDVGDRVSLTNLPANISADDPDLILEGYRERLTPWEWTAELNCAQYKPYRVFQIAEDSGDTDEFLGRLAEDEQCAIRAAINSSTTSISFDPAFYRWTAAADDFPMTVRFGGETATVSSIATTAATFVAAGAASHADNAAVTPALYAGNTTQDLILVFAAIRSSGTGTLLTPTGYTRLPVWASTDNVQLYAKVHSGSESNPTVTPFGGSAGDTVSAVTFGFRGMPVTLDDLADLVVEATTFLNGSAQDIIHPPVYPIYQQGCVILVLGWKQDDWTSVATLGGLAEITDSPTTTGSDQGLVADYLIQTTPTLIGQGTFTVTGGAAAISRAATVALAGGYQTLTLSARSVNGVVKSHTAATRLEIEDAGILAL